MVRRNDSRRRPHLFPAVTLAIAFTLTNALARAEEPLVRSLSGSGMSWAAVAFREAEDKLSHSACRQVFSDLRGLRGDSVQSTLDAPGEDGFSYLARLDFYGGNRSRPCGGSEVVAFTRPGSWAVFSARRSSKKLIETRASRDRS